MGERKLGRKKGPASKTAKVRRKRFAAEVIKAVAAGETLADAAVAVGLSENGAGPAGSRMLGHPEVQAEIARQLDRAMGADEILERLTNMGRIDISEFVRADGGLKLQEAFEKGKGALISAIDVEDATENRGSVTKIKLHNALDALKTLAKVRGLLKDNSTPPPPVSVNLTLALKDVPEEALDALLGALAKHQAIPIQATSKA